MMKPKRRLKNFNFEQEGSHVALVGKHQGGPANGYTTLVTKATHKIPESFIEKATQVQVTMNIEDFLRKFFGLYYDDAEILARMLGYETESMGEDPYETYEDYIQAKVDSVQIMKSIFKADNVSDAVAGLDETTFEKFLKDQKMIEEAMSSEVEKSIEGVSNQNVEKTKEDVTEMSEETKDVVQKSEVQDMIAKAVEKAVGELNTKLEKAQETIQSYEAKEAEARTEARKQVLKDAVKDEEKAEKLFKSFDSLDDESFTEAVQTLKSLTSAVEEGEMFAEKGVDTEQEKPAARESATATYLKSKYNAEK